MENINESWKIFTRWKKNVRKIWIYYPTHIFSGLHLIFHIYKGKIFENQENSSHSFFFVIRAYTLLSVYLCVTTLCYSNKIPRGHHSFFFLQTIFLLSASPTTKKKTFRYHQQDENLLCHDFFFRVFPFFFSYMNSQINFYKIKDGVKVFCHYTRKVCNGEVH